MKKTAAVLALALLLLCLAPAFASADAEPVIIPLLDEVPWDMTVDDLLAFLGKTKEEASAGHYADERMEGYMDMVQFAGYPCLFITIFIDGKPSEIAVATLLEENTSQILAEMKAELEKAYGEPNSDNYALLKAAIASTGGEIQNEKLFDAAEKYLWELPDGKTMLLALDHQGVGFTAIRLDLIP